MSIDRSTTSVYTCDKPGCGQSETITDSNPTFIYLQVQLPGEYFPRSSVLCPQHYADFVSSVESDFNLVNPSQGQT